MMSYFTLNESLNQAVKIPVITRANLPFCGFLSPKLSTVDLPKGSLILVPIYLVKALSHINIFQVEPNDIINEKTAAELAIMPNLYSPQIYPSVDFKSVSQFLVKELSKKHENLRINYQKSLLTAIEQRNKLGGEGLTEKENQAIKAKKECLERFEKVMCVRFK